MYITHMIKDPTDRLLRAERLRAARQAAGYASAKDAARAFGWNYNSYGGNENGNAPYSFAKALAYGAAFKVSPEWLYAGRDAPDADAGALGEPTGVPVIGHVGADPSGCVLFATGQGTDEFVPLPPGGGHTAVALKVVGHSMPGLAEDGALIYFEDQRTPPSPDMLGHVVVVETDDDQVLVKRLFRGARAGRFDLASIAGPTLHDRRLRWAAHVTAIIPPFQARRILRGVR